MQIYNFSKNFVCLSAQIPKTNENIAQYAEKYKLISKQLTKIMHSVKDEIDLEYSILKDSIEVKRKTDKEQLYKLNSFKELFMRKKNREI